MRDPARLDQQLTGARFDDLVAHLRVQAAAEDERVLVLVRVRVHRRAELVRWQVVLDQAERPTRLRAGEHPPRSERLPEAHVLALPRLDLQLLRLHGSSSSALSEQGVHRSAAHGTLNTVFSQMPEKKRTYELRERAKKQEETRRRIVEATVALHEEVGPA